MAISSVALFGFIALAVDLGMLMVAKTQAQNAADAAAFAGARTLTGGTNANTTQATTNGQDVAAANKILGKTIPAANVTMAHGAYHYNSSTQTLTPNFPPVSPDNYNLAQATITQGSSTAFANIFGMSSFNVTATAIAAHRPRDTSIVLDFSGSMNNESDLWNCESYEGSYEGTSNNTDPVYPQWGFYNTTFSPNGELLCTSSSDLTGYCNISQVVGGCGPQVNDYYQNNRGASAVSAFSSATAWPGSDSSARHRRPRAPCKTPPRSRPTPVTRRSRSPPSRYHPLSRGVMGPRQSRKPFVARDSTFNQTISSTRAADLQAALS